MAPPGPVKIGHKKDGHRRRPHRFHVSRPIHTQPLDPLLQSTGNYKELCPFRHENKVKKIKRQEVILFSTNQTFLCFIKLVFVLAFFRYFLWAGGGWLGRGNFMFKLDSTCSR